MMGEQNIPVVGGEYVYKGQNVRVTDLIRKGRPRKDGAPGQVVYVPVANIGDTVPKLTARMADWLKGVQ